MVLSGGQPISIFLINLDRSTDRLRDMQGQLSRLGLAFERVPGILGSALPPALQPYFCDASGRIVSPLGAGEIGCHAAHLSIYRRMASGAADAVALVLEDDCVLPGDLPEVVSRVLAAAPPDWDIVRLSNAPKRAYVPVADLGDGRRIVRYSKIPNLTQAYMLTASAAKKLSGDGLRVHAIDDYLRRSWLHGLHTYGVVPAPIGPRSVSSDIDALGQRRMHGRWDQLAKIRSRSDLRHLASRIRFNVGALGVERWAACTAINVADHLVKGVSGRTIIHRAAPLLAMRSCRRSLP